MIEKECPYKASCLVASSLHSLNIPTLSGYCRDNFQQCKYYRKRYYSVEKETVEVGA